MLFRWLIGLRTDAGHPYGVAGCSFELYAESGFYYAIPWAPYYDNTWVHEYTSAETTIKALLDFRTMLSTTPSMRFTGGPGED